VARVDEERGGSVTVTGRQRYAGWTTRLRTFASAPTGNATIRERSYAEPVSERRT